MTKSKKPSTYSRECIYDPPTNGEIVSLRDQYEKARVEVKRIASEIERVQSECEHTYFFTTSGPYEDYYECSKCGHETEI